MKWIPALLLMTLVSCTNLSQNTVKPGVSDAEKCSITLTLSGTNFDQTQSRSIVADFTTAIHRWHITLETSGHNPVTAEADNTSESVTISGLVAGEWDITVSGYNISGNIAARGTLTGQRIDQSVGTISIPIHFIKSPDGTGGFHVTLRFPSSTGIDNVTAKFRDEELTTDVTSDGTMTTAILSKNTIPSGNYPLFITFKRGEKIAGTFVEAVNIRDNVISTMLIAADGTLTDRMEFTGTDFFDANANIGNIEFTNSVEFVFSSDTKAYQVLLTEGTTQCTITESIPGQKIEYSWGKGSAAFIKSGEQSAALPLTEENRTLTIRITAPDRVTTETYTFHFTRSSSPVVTLTVTPAFQKFQSSASAVNVTAGTDVSIAVDLTGTVSASWTDWKWYENNTQIPDMTSSTLTYSTTDKPGEHIIYCSAIYNGIFYSGEVKITVKSPVMYTVSYHANGGALEPDNSLPADATITPGGSHTVQAQPVMTKPGYTLHGWNIQADGEGMKYSANDTITNINSNIVLYAIWLSTANDITSFSIKEPEKTGGIDGNKITVIYDEWIDRSNLIVDFTTTGKVVKIGSTVQISGVTANDFTNAVTYTVAAEDSSYTKVYTVNVITAEQAALSEVTPRYRELVDVSGGTFLQQFSDTQKFGHTISSFKMAKYEVTYELWYKVRMWAIDDDRGDKKYVFANAGMEGSVTGGGNFPNYSNIGKTPSESGYEPVTMASWRDAIVWCNAYSEMSGLSPLYTTDGEIVWKS